MARGAGRGAVACASGLNWCAFILLLFATISSYWTWGYTNPQSGSPYTTSVDVSIGPWLAGQAWSTYWVPCCTSGICTYCSAGTSALFWNQLNAENACSPTSKVYLNWAKPLGYCTFPADAQIPEGPPANTKSYDTWSTVPTGTVYHGPSQPISVQALMITSVVVVFIAAVAGCADAGMEDSHKAVGVTAAGFSLIGWVFVLAAYCLWTTFPYVSNIQSSTGGIYMPVWYDYSSNLVTAIPATSVWLGPGWATALTSSILVFIANLIHCASVAGFDGSEDEMEQGPAKSYNNAPPADLVPDQSPVPAAVVPSPYGTNVAKV